MLRAASVGLFAVLVGCSGANPSDPIAAPAATDPAKATPTEPGSGGQNTINDPGASPSTPTDPGPTASTPTCTSITVTPSVIEQRPAQADKEQSWDDTNDARSADGQGASVVLSQARTSSYDLFARDFGLALDPNATINGIVVEVTRQTTGTRTKDAVLTLVKVTNNSYSELSDDVAKEGAWATGAWSTATYGGPKDTIGAKLTPAMLNAASTAIHFAVMDNDTIGGPNATVRVDAIKLTVHSCTP